MILRTHKDLQECPILFHFFKAVDWTGRYVELSASGNVFFFIYTNSIWMTAVLDFE
jgi:hypothetical protein